MGPDQDPTLDTHPVRANKAPIVKRGAEGPGVLQVPIVTLEGGSPLQPRDPIKTQGWTRILSEQTKLSSLSAAPRDRRPPGADSDLEGCSPLQPWDLRGEADMLSVAL